jgi:hypothetical protein
LASRIGPDLLSLGGHRGCDPWFRVHRRDAQTCGLLGGWIGGPRRRDCTADKVVVHLLRDHRRTLNYPIGGFARRGKEIPLEVINDISFSQSFGERIFRSGDLVIESAGEHGQSRYSDVPDPEGLQAHVYRLRESRIRDLSQPTAAEDLERLVILYRRGVLTEDEYEAKKLQLVEEQDSKPSWSSP